MLNPNITTFLFGGVEGTVLITLEMAREYILYSNLIADMGDGLKKKLKGLEGNNASYAPVEQFYEQYFTYFTARKYSSSTKPTQN